MDSTKSIYEKAAAAADASAEHFRTECLQYNKDTMTPNARQRAELSDHLGESFERLSAVFTAAGDGMYRSYEAVAEVGAALEVLAAFLGQSPLLPREQESAPLAEKVELSVLRRTRDALEGMRVPDGDGPSAA